MASLGQSFSQEDLPQQSGDYSPIPEGWYTAIIHSATIKDTKDKTGQYIAIRYDVVAPSHQGRVIFGNINIKNKSSQAEEIGRGQLGSLIRAIGLARIEDTDQLEGPVMIKVGTVPAVFEEDGKTVKYEANNDIKGYKAIEGFQEPASSKSTGSSPPWAKK